MSSGTALLQQCAAQFGSDNATALLECALNAGSSGDNTETLEGIISGIDTFYLIFAGALVYFMQTGFAMLCAGSIRAKNVKNVILWNLLDSAGGGLAFWATGFAFAYGGDDADRDEKTFIGNTDFFVVQNGDVRLEQWFFQFTFACALSSIVAGTIAERTQMKAYLMYSVFLVGFVYPVVAHSFWSPHGFLSKGAVSPLWDSGVIDLAGSGAVHMTGGVAALVGTLILGPRLGRFYDRDGNPLEEPAEIVPHSTALQFLGTFCLWFGWYGFNPGSVLSISNSGSASVAALVVVNTTLGACAGAVSAMFTSSLFDWRSTGVFTYDVAYTMNGCLTGLVAITAGCATVQTWAAVIIGIVAGWLYIGASKLLIRFRIDDAVDAVPVHMIGGAWGMISTGLFTAPDLLNAAFPPSDEQLAAGIDANPHFGWFYHFDEGSGDFTLLGIQIIAVLWVFGWVFVLMGFWFGIINYMGWFRIDPLEEEVGMDISRHKGSAYDYTSPDNEDVQKLQESRHDSSLRGSKRKSNTKEDHSENVSNPDKEEEVAA